MKRDVYVAAALAIAVVAAVAGLAYREARKDRAALLRAFGDEHLERLRLATSEIDAQLADVAQHLEFAARLVASARSGADQRRELEALLAVVRAYRVVGVYDSSGRERVVALDPTAPASWSFAPFAESVAETARTAASRRELSISPPLADAGPPWHRAFGMPIAADGRSGAVVILLDMRSVFERLQRLAPDGSARLLLLGPHGVAAPLTDPAFAEALDQSGQGGPLYELVERMRLGESGALTLSSFQARALTLGDVEAVAVFAPIPMGGAGHWAAAVVASTASLGAQERSILVRTGVLGGVFALASFALAAYLIVSAQRSIAVRERLRAAEQVAHHREKSEKILENVPVGVVALDAGGSITAVNRTAREQLPPSALGRPLAAALPGAPPAALEGLLGLVGEARASGKVQRLVAQPLALSGPEGYFAVHAVPLSHPLPDVDLLLMLEDVTELRTLSSQLLRAEKLATVGVLAAGIAHEVGTPLGVVRGRAEILLAKLGPASPLGEGATVIVEEIDRVSRTIQELLDFSRTSRAAAVAVGLADAAADVVGLLAFEARSRKVSLVVQVPETVPRLAADPDQLKQVLVNLTLNSIHACTPGGHVWLRAGPTPHGGCVAVEVADDGTGIPEGLRHRVFDPFFTTKKRGKGTGLGLTVAAQIVRNHGGDIDLESAVGEGTRVTVTWPVARTDTEESDGQAERRAHSRGR